MRDLALILCILSGLAATLRYPFAGIMLWTWFAIMNPHQEAFSWSHLFPLNLIIAVVVGLAWLVSSERKLPPTGPTVILLGVFLLWVTFNTFFAADPERSWEIWDLVWKICAMCVVASAMTVNKVRFHALVWVVVLSLCYYGIKGGLFTIVSGGGDHVYGPPNTIIGDNNQLALAIVMILPLLNYLRLHSGSRFVRWAIIAAMVLDLLTVLGSYSRGGIIALASLVLASWFRTKRKFTYPIAAALVILPLLQFMPQSFFDRVNSINQYQTDDSFQGRVQAWEVAVYYASSHFPFGAGFYGPESPQVWRRYFPTGNNHAAHSIYFQVLGENGFVGFGIYLVLIVSAFLNCRAVIRNSKGRPELAWANDLARMMQLSLFGFCVGGAGLSMAYYDVFLLWICLSASLREQTSAARVRDTITLARANVPFAGEGASPARMSE